MKYLYFSSTTCSPCKQLSPIMDKVKQKGIPVIKVDIDEKYELTIEYGIRSVPTVILIDNGGFELSRITGINSEEFYINLYKKNNNNNLD